jgi:hypothetical protein
MNRNRGLLIRWSKKDETISRSCTSPGPPRQFTGDPLRVLSKHELAPCIWRG